jgi:hypothetical protein
VCGEVGGHLVVETAGAVDEVEVDGEALNGFDYAFWWRPDGEIWD